MAQVYAGIGSNIEPARNIRSGLTTDDLALRENGLQLPRDEITRHPFVLRPLAEVAGDRRHPLLGITFAELWAAFDQSRETLRPVALGCWVTGIR
jgi:2-amino-4-hydroxy-6-hydroxymethyldihydropteridine diphosphokinase